ncbi:polysaccharide deacetylase family protein [Tuberibacillus sp. Marseille-P3662]|uniref:polysaccharide deacetylase family protein n=1 Tax=Tuberibacillus sp. Marseille-P3662 TaxID=1965358 RepID=UPI000A1CC4A0|nr:polysaccharide deacetylase family protein [Tuberibacillus sp. Marseille-P3662]
MVTIDIPNRFTQELNYIIKTIFGDFLGIDYEIINSDRQNYRVVLDNGKQLFIDDAFFSEHHHLDYLSQNHIPSKIIFTKNRFTPESDLPILYGNERLDVDDKIITCGIDIFASAFFMLTRWEEYVKPERDHFDRFPASASTAYKYDFLHRPIVNEYVEFLWSMLQYLGIEQERRKREYRLIPTHDVDQINYWKNAKTMVKSSAKALIRKKDVVGSIRPFMDYSKIKLRLKEDPYHTFDWLMDLSEAAGLTSRFYFMSGGVTNYDNFYQVQSSQVKRLTNHMLDRGHEIGFHPSFQTYKHPEQLEWEKQALESVVGFKVTEGRHHYLRFSVPHTWQLWEDHGLLSDSTMSYADHEGFRCGTCYEFHPFNILTRQTLQLMEYPLIAMEVSLGVYQSITWNDMFEKMKKLANTVQKYNGNFVFLWHNSNFNTGIWSQLGHAYKPIIQQLSKND